MPESVMVATRGLVERERTIATFIATHLKRTGERGDILTLQDVYAHYLCDCEIQGGKSAEKKSVLKDELVEVMGPCPPPLHGQRNYWRGWKLLSDASNSD